MTDIVQNAAISLRLPKSLLQKLDAQAKKEHRTRGNLIRVLLEKALDKKGESR